MNDSPESGDIEAVVRSRLRALRQTLALSLDDLAERTNLSPSTISRIETGRRSISLDVLVPLAGALQVDLDSLFDLHHDTDVVIRPVPNTSMGHTARVLSRPTSANVVVRMTLEAPRRRPQLRVHPGHDWFHVLEGQVRLYLGDREIIVECGEAAEFATMTPHAIAAEQGPAEVITIFSHEAQRAHADG